MPLLEVLEKYRNISFSQSDKGSRFERLMKAYLLTDPKYSYSIDTVWLWSEFPYREQISDHDTGIDLVAKTKEGYFWAIQCKFYKEESRIDKASVDSFFTTSSRKFKVDNVETQFSFRLWIDTTEGVFTSHAYDSFKNQTIPTTILTLSNLLDAPVDWDKLEEGISGANARKSKKELRPHQIEALNKTADHFNYFDRGKLIMACGTGKTFTSLRIAENLTNGKGFVLFLVPSIALLGQTLNEWFYDAQEDLKAICICSDPEVSKKKKQMEDLDTSSVVDLAYPASTDKDEILQQFERFEQSEHSGLTVVFSTYQSIEVVARVQKLLKERNSKFAKFDLIICDEAHRTTGVTLYGEDVSSFTKVHDGAYIHADKRLYMTATPRLYNEDTKAKALQNEAILCSMDEEKLYGTEIYRIGFGEAVEKGLLSDYKVLILTLNEHHVPKAVQDMISNDDHEIKTYDVPKLIGCINAMSKQILGDEGIIKDTDPEPIRRAVAFCQSIKVSKKITTVFNETANDYIWQLPKDKQLTTQRIASKHIDGGMNATERNQLLSWLKGEPAPQESRVLTNVRCLSEGVDVPSLDAVLFLSAKNSQVDVVQSVGRVMRKSPGKKYGYIIIPIFVPSNVEADKALDDNERYKVVWTVLNALRAHDDRFNAVVNKIELNKKRPDQILVGSPEVSFDKDGNAVYQSDNENENSARDLAEQFVLNFEGLQSEIYARMVKKVGDRLYWEQWAKSVAEIAQRQIERITSLINDNTQYNEVFANFMKGLHKSINPSVTKEEAIDMLSQHIITKPVFEALFEGYSFVKNNAMSQAMQSMLDLLQQESLEGDLAVLERFYHSVRQRASGIDNAEGKQRIIIELYDKFFKTAFPKMVERLGIVYTPVEVVDFIIHSVNDILQKEFGRSISDENIHILDPFTGTGTFITRLLQSGLIRKEDLERKYKYELHANEIVLLAYYIAAINIENAYHDATPNPDDGIGTDQFTPFDGIVLTDTFQLGESNEGDKLFSNLFEMNTERVQRQKNAPVQIIFGNPPYSVGQKSKNDLSKNQIYPILDKKIAQTYVNESQILDPNTNSLKKYYYDPYIKSFRWSTDRLKDSTGIICFVTNGGWIQSNSLNGFRKSLEKEFTSIYVLNLRGNQVTSGELSRKEGGKIFGSGSKNSIAITLLVKNPKLNQEKASIYYHDIGDYLSRLVKLEMLNSFTSFENIPLIELQPNENSDWINLRNKRFLSNTELAPLKKYDFKSNSFFILNTNGVVSGRSNWVYNFSKSKLTINLTNTIDFFNNQIEEFKRARERNATIVETTFIDTDEKKIKWDDKLISKLKGEKKLFFNKASLRVSYRTPFCKEFFYFDSELNWSRLLLPKVFPNNSIENIMISSIGKGASRDFSVLVSDSVTDFHFVQNGQSFPLFYYEENNKKQDGLFVGEEEKQYTRRDAISDYILQEARKKYGNKVTKEDIFYYVYGFLHSKEYRETFANDLKKMLPRLPLVDKTEDFWAFSTAGRELAELHLYYETVPPCPGVITLYNPLTMTDTLKQANEKELEYVHYRVEKMRFPKKDQKDTIIYNNHITIENIPAKAYEYIVNGKSAIEWIMERYQVTTHKESGIKNDPNDWSAEVDNPKYIYNLLLSIINVSVQTVDIVNNLPKITFE